MVSASTSITEAVIYWKEPENAVILIVDSAELSVVGVFKLSPCNLNNPLSDL